MKVFKHMTALVLALVMAAALAVTAYAATVTVKYREFVYSGQITFRQYDYSQSTSPTVVNMTISATSSLGSGSALYHVKYANGTVAYCIQPGVHSDDSSSYVQGSSGYQNISGLVGQAPLDYTADNLDDAELENPAAEALREFWLKHRLTILLTLAVLLAAGMVGLLIGWLIFERRRTKKRKEGFFGADAAASIDAIFRYMMDVLRARGMAAKNCPPADYVSYMDEDLREEYLAAAKLWQEARFRGKPMQELQRRRVLRLKDEIWERTWHSASLKERLRLKYVEFL